MLDAILRHLATSDLVNCRRVNRKWNEISSCIMRHRADIQIVFKFFGKQLMQAIQYPPPTLLVDFWRPINEDSSLSFNDMVQCLKQSENFPFTSFRFKTAVKVADIAEFLSIWGRSILALGVLVEVPDDVEMLRFALEKTPNLRELYVDFGSIDFYNDSTSVNTNRLFDGSNEFQLPALYILRVKGSCGYFSDVLSDILKVAPNLECFEKSSLDKKHCQECIDAKDLAVLQLRNKVHSLKKVNFLFKKELIEFLEKTPEFMDLPFKSIKLSITWIWDDDQLSARAVQIINKIFDSSKSSLEELYIPPVGLLSELVIPEFKNLQKLCLSHDESYEEGPGPSMFPPHFEMIEHFPNLKELSKSITV